MFLSGELFVHGQLDLNKRGAEKRTCMTQFSFKLQNTKLLMPNYVVYINSPIFISENHFLDTSVN